MSGFAAWALLSVAGWLSVPLGINSIDAAGACMWFSGVGLFMHWVAEK